MIQHIGSTTQELYPRFIATVLSRVIFDGDAASLLRTHLTGLALGASRNSHLRWPHTVWYPGLDQRPEAVPEPEGLIPSGTPFVSVAMPGWPFAVPW